MMSQSSKWLWAILALVSVSAAADAHSAGVRCKLHGGRIVVEGYFDDDSPTVRAQVRVLAGDTEVASGVTDEKGLWSFDRPAPGKYLVKLDAGGGHHAKETITVPPSGDAATEAPIPIGDAVPREEFTRFPVLGVLYGLLIIAGLAAAFVLIAAIRKRNPGT